MKVLSIKCNRGPLCFCPSPLIFVCARSAGGWEDGLREGRSSRKMTLRAKEGNFSFSKKFITSLAFLCYWNFSFFYHTLFKNLVLLRIWNVLWALIARYCM